MKKVIIIIVVIIIAVLGYFYLSSNREITTVQSISVKLDTVNNSGEFGTATLVAEGTGTNVSLNLSGSPQDITQPAHIHIGSCPGIEAVKYPLNFPVNGLSETLLDVSLDQLLSELPLAINVHKSPQEANIYVACGNIAL